LKQDIPAIDTRSKTSLLTQMTEEASDEINHRQRFKYAPNTPEGGKERYEYQRQAKIYRDQAMQSDPNFQAQKAQKQREKDLGLGLSIFTSAIRGLTRFGKRVFNKAYDPLYDMHPLVQRYNSISNAARELHKSKSTIYKLLEEPWEAIRINSEGHGNSFSIANPFVYVENGQMSVEYQCPDEIKKLIGQSVPIIIGHENADPETLEPRADTIIGTYTITGYDEEKGAEISKYDIDDRKLNDFVATHPQYRWAVQNGTLRSDAEDSTGYFCEVHYDPIKKKRIQKGFKLKHLAIVEKGNCTRDHCSRNQ
jgi:hypothetical protein